MEVSLFSNYSSRLPQCSTLEEVAELIRSDERVAALTQAFRATGDASVKQSSPLFGVAAVFRSGKKQTDIVALTGLSLVDVDHVATDRPTLDELKRRAEADAHTLLCYRTISGHGLRIVFRYELDTAYSLEQQKLFYPRAFAVGNAYYTRLLGVETDLKCKNVGRLSGLAHDAEVYLNAEAVPFAAADIEEAAEKQRRLLRTQQRQRRELTRLQATYERIIRPEVEADGAVYGPGSHNDYVMRVGYKLNQFGFSLQAALEWAATAFADYDRASDILTSCYQKTEEFGTRKSRTPRKDDAPARALPWAEVGAIRDFISRHAHLRHNVITGRVEIELKEKKLKELKEKKGKEKNELKDKNFKEEGKEEEEEEEELKEKKGKEKNELKDKNFKGEGKEEEELKEKKLKEKNELKDKNFKGEEPEEIETGEGEERWEPVTDRIVNSLWAQMSAEWRVNVMDIYRVILSDFVPEYHPFRAYLQALPPAPATGSGAIARLAQTVRVRGGEAVQQRWEEYLRKWLVGMVAAWVDDAVVNNVILVLIGEQGSYKTTWFQYLLPPSLRRYFYTKTNANRLGRDELLTLAQYGLVCCEELDTMRPAELNQLKAAVTMSSIDERAAYAHFHEHRPHIASFCGTGNNVQFLSDPTGNRRWLPFEVESITSPRDVPFDHDAIYAEAYALYRSGFRFWFSRQEIAELADYNRKFETPRLEWELVQQYFRLPAEGESGEFMPVAAALQLVAGSISQKLSPVHMGRAFRELGFEQRVVRHVRGYIVVRYTAAEMQQRRHLAALI